MGPPDPADTAAPHAGPQDGSVAAQPGRGGRGCERAGSAGLVTQLAREGQRWADPGVLARPLYSSQEGLAPASEHGRLPSRGTQVLCLTGSPLPQLRPLSGDWGWPSGQASAALGNCLQLATLAPEGGKGHRPAGTDWPLLAPGGNRRRPTLRGRAMPSSGSPLRLRQCQQLRGTGRPACPLQPSSHALGEAGTPLTARGTRWCSPTENSPQVPARPATPAASQQRRRLDAAPTAALPRAPPRDAHHTASP